MQIVPETDVAELLDRLVEDELPGGRGMGAWDSFLRAHATLMRRLDTDLERETGLPLADFDVLAQLAAGHGELRMTELADREQGRRGADHRLCGLTSNPATAWPTYGFRTLARLSKLIRCQAGAPPLARTLFLRTSRRFR